MYKRELIEKTDNLIQVTHNALQLIIDELNYGQRQKLIKNEEVKKLLDRYEVDYER